MKGLCLSTGGERGVEWLAAVALAAAAAWLAPAPLSAQDPSTPVTPEMKQVTVDLGSGTINAVLPFDEPFLLVGTPPPQTIRIEATYCEIAERSARELGSLLANAPASSGSLSLCVGGPAKANRLLPWTGQTTSFQLLVPDRLPVNRNFLFQFTIARALSDSELAALKTQVRSELDRELRTIDATQPASLGAAQYDQLLATIRRVLAAQPLAAGQVPQPEAGSVFDPAAASADAGDFAPPWQEPLRRVYETQQQRRVVVQPLGSDPSSRVTALFTALRAVRQDPAIAALQAAVDGLSAADRSDLSHLLPDAALQGLQILASADNQRLAAIASGVEAPGGTSAAVPADTLASDLWTPTQVTPVAANVATTTSALRALGELTKTAEQVTALSTALGPNVDQMAGLRAKLGIAAAAAASVSSSLLRMSSILDSREKALDDLANYLRREAAVRVPIVASSTGSFTTRAAFHISADIGILYAGEIGEVLPYFGANFYTRAVNRDVPLSVLGGFRRRFSFLLGVTYSSIKEMDGTRVLRDDLFGSQALVAGAGLRLTDTARINGGVLVFQENSPNPLIDDLRLSEELFVSISFDWNIKSLLGKLGTAITGP